MVKSTPMTKADLSRIQSSQAKAGRDMTSSGFAARAQGAGDKNSDATSGATAGATAGAKRSGGGQASKTGGGKKKK